MANQFLTFNNKYNKYIIILFLLSFFLKKKITKASKLANLLNLFEVDSCKMYFFFKFEICSAVPVIYSD